MIFVLETVGTIAFAIAGAMVGVEKKMDILGIVILGTTNAVGGGIIRDLIIGVTPPVAFQKPLYAVLSIVTSLIVFIPFVRNKIKSDNFLLLLLDSIGLGVFTVIGVQAGIEYENLFLRVFLGTITGVGGGVIRDLFATEHPLIFVRHFYASACIIGSILCSIIIQFNQSLALVIGIEVIIILRICAATFKWNLPRAD